MKNINIQFAKMVPTIIGCTVEGLKSALNAAGQFSIALSEYLMVKLECAATNDTAKDVCDRLNVASKTNVSTINSVLSGIAKLANQAQRNCEADALALLIAPNGNLNVKGSRETAAATKGLDHSAVTAARGIDGIRCIGGAMGCGADKCINAADTIAANLGALSASNFAEWFSAWKIEVKNQAKEKKEKDIVKTFEGLCEVYFTTDNQARRQAFRLATNRFCASQAGEGTKYQQDEVAEALATIG